MANQQFTIRQSHPPITGSIFPEKADDTPGVIQAGTLEYSSDNEGVLTIVEDPNDELKFTITVVGTGFARIYAKGDADLGEGVVHVENIDDFTVIADAEELVTELRVVYDNLTPATE